MDVESTAEEQSKILKTVPIIRDLSLNPSCDHGPTILFERDGKQFFSCSAYRTKKLCEFYMPEEKWNGISEKSKGKKERCRIKRKHEESPFENVSGKQAKVEVNHPLLFPNQQNKGEAQYHFNDASVDFFMEQFKNLEIDSVLCIGTPSLHQHIIWSQLPELTSFLLDIDKRFIRIYKEAFTLYNMCNHHFFNGKENYLKFVSGARKLAVVVDPPFGVKVELIWHGCLSGIKNDLERFGHAAGSSGSSDFDIFWVFPYFMEGHILNRCPGSGLTMSDFHVEYRNHPKYSGSKSKSSPIRAFTNVSLSSLVLPKEEYRYCDSCAKWVDKQNLHCAICGTCATKDGGNTYIHCGDCGKCVKPTWKHCQKCKVCHLANLPECSDLSSGDKEKFGYVRNKKGSKANVFNRSKSSKVTVFSKNSHVKRKKNNPKY